MAQKKVILLTDAASEKGEKIIIGVESIIDCKIVTKYKNTIAVGTWTRIQSRGAMITTNVVTETPEEIYALIQETHDVGVMKVLKDLRDKFHSCIEGGHEQEGDLEVIAAADKLLKKGGYNA